MSTGPKPVAPSSLVQVVITAVVVVSLIAAYQWVSSNLHVSITWGHAKPVDPVTPKPDTPKPKPDWPSAHLPGRVRAHG